MPSSDPLLALDGLAKRFGDTNALDGISLSVGAGEMVGFVGRNGAGKTTTMRIALGLLIPDSGTVRFEGAPPSATDRRRHFGYMPEERGLYPKMAIGEQLTYLARLSGVGARQATEASLRWLDRLGLGARTRDTLESLSLGNQQRVQLAAAVVHGPRVLVLDEPFSGLDPAAVDVLSRSLQELASAGAGIIFSSHQLELVERLCEKVIIIDAGKVVADGSIADLRARQAGRVIRVEIGNHSDTAWAAGVTGVASVTADPPDRDRGAAALVHLRDDADEQLLLDAARSAGPVRHFSTVTPTLAELFREVIAA